MTALPAFTTHHDDFRELARYDGETQSAVRLHLALCEEIASASDGVVKAAERIAFRFYGQPRMSAKSILRRYYAYIKTQDWRVFIHKGKLAAKTETVSPETVEYWRALCERNQRKCRPAHRQLINQWRSGQTIPGLGTWRDYWRKQGLDVDSMKICPDDLPEGMSYRHLMRYKPDPVELSLTRQGNAAARSLLPSHIGTRAGMRPLEYIAFDDVELDFLVVVPGVEKPCKLRALVCKDVATDCWLRYTLRPAIVREDGAQDGLKLRDMKRLCLELLMHWGYPVDYVSHWIVERGTATLPEADIAALRELSAGMIEVKRTGMIAGKVLLGGFADKAVGNSWAKAWIESGFNLVHNELAHLPGQKGRRYDLAPAELENRKKEAVTLMRAGRALPVELRAMLRLPFFSLQQAEKEIFDALMRINQMQGHGCEGFDDIVQWRLAEGDQWQPYEKLLGLPAEMMEHVHVNRRVETRFERWVRLTQDVTIKKMPEEFAPRWMDDHRTVTVEKYQIKFVHEGKTLTFFDRDSALLYEGAEYLAYYNPHDLTRIYLTNADGGFRGSLPLVNRVSRDDEEALSKRLADVRATLNKHLSSIRQRHVADTEQTIADMEHNLIQFEQAPSVPLLDQLNEAVADTAAKREHENTRRRAARTLDAANLLDAEPDRAETADPDRHDPLDPSIFL